VPLDREWLAAHLPQQGRMCLLDEVLSWDARLIRCRSGTHRDPQHPLRAHGRLGAVCGVEYAAQAMAAHAALLGAPAMARAELARVRELELRVEALDAIGDELLIEAERLSAGGGGALYAFSLYAQQALLLRGRALVRHG
jgi:predicted hotdog family 3-hydroxylacyl-ACP dehydratase